MSYVSTVFKNGPSTQAIRIPKELRIDTKQVWIDKTATGLNIRPKPNSWDDFFYDSPEVTSDFEMIRNDLPHSKRDFSS